MCQLWQFQKNVVCPMTFRRASGPDRVCIFQVPRHGGPIDLSRKVPERLQSFFSEKASPVNTDSHNVVVEQLVVRDSKRERKVQDTKHKQANVASILYSHMSPKIQIVKFL